MTAINRVSILSLQRRGKQAGKQANKQAPVSFYNFSASKQANKQAARLNLECVRKPLRNTTISRQVCNWNPSVRVPERWSVCLLLENYYTYTYYSGVYSGEGRKGRDVEVDREGEGGGEWFRLGQMRLGQVRSGAFCSRQSHSNTFP